MTVQELFKECSDVDKLFKRYLELYYKDDDGNYATHLGIILDADKLAAFKNRITGFYKHIIEIEPFDDGQKKLLFIIPYVQLNGDFSSKTIKSSPNKDICMYDGKEFYSMIFAEWPKVMAWTISKSIFQDMDKYTAAAHIMWEISFCGYTEEEQQAEREKLDESIKESEEHPEKLIPAEDVFEKLGYKDERSPEEKAFDKDIIIQEQQQNTVIQNKYYSIARKEFAEK